MLLLIFLLIPNIFAISIKMIDDYSITIDNNVLTNIIPFKSINRDINNALNLSGLHISSIGKQAFNNVPDIERLDLSRNDISILDSGVFSRLRKLKHLSLANNTLEHFYKAFEGLEHLEVLDISNTSVRRLGKSDLFGIPKSTVINTNGDDLQSISRAVFAETYANESAQSILCTHAGIVTSLKHWPNSKFPPTGCTRVQIDLVNPHWIRLNQLGISGFDRDWYHLHNTEIDGLDLSGNNIVDITSAFVNGLPHRLKFIDLSKNKIERVKKGSIVHRNLECLYLSGNLINEIENDAFKTASLYWLRLDGNRLNDIRFVATLPRNLLRLNLRNNQLSELHLPRSFSTLHDLTKLDLAQNHITELKMEHFLGLKSLRNLDLQENGLKKMYSGCFDRISNLKTLNLSNNHLSNLEYNVFHTVPKIEKLDLSHNKLLTLTGLSPLERLKYLYLNNNALTNLNRAFVGLFNLHLLDISYNPIPSAKSDDFTGVPKTANIISNGNAISCISLEDQPRELPKAILLCMTNGIVTAVRQMTHDDTPLPRECQIVKREELLWSGFEESALSLEDRRISGFAKNWYNLQVHVSMIILDHNVIVDVTSEMLNDLPENVKYVYLRGNQIERLKKGVVVNKHLRALRLDRNKISEIEEDALVNTNLLEVDVSYNSLQGVRFLVGIPPSLTHLDASGNYLTDITAGSFSRLNKLRILHLNNVRLNKIGPEAFRGLSFLKLLSLEANDLTTIDKNAFQHTKVLETLNLEKNHLQSLDNLLFHGLDNLLHVNLNFNKFKTMTKDSLPHFPDALQSLKLENNQISHVETGSFVGRLKYELSLYSNCLTTIDKGAFNLPDLVKLDLSHNWLSQVSGDSFENMSSLEKLYLNENKIAKIDKDAVKYLNKLYMLDLSDNPITELQNGAFFGLSNLPNQKFEGSILVYGTPIKHIRGGLFGDESHASYTVVSV